jgi:tetratricopeptide (TPR) repeat protein
MHPAKLLTSAFCLTGLLAPALAQTQAEEDRAITDFDTLIKAGKYSEVSAPLESYTKAHLKSWQALYQLGYVEFRLHRIRHSVTVLAKSLVLNPDFSESHKILAYDFNILGHQDLAVRELERAISHNPGSAESHYELGRIYYEQGSYLKAIEHLEKAKALEPESVHVYHNLGLAYAAVADNPKALENFEAGLRLNGQQNKPSAWPFIDYATYSNMEGNFERARDLLLRAIQIDQSWDQEYEELAKAYRGLGQTAEAIGALRQAVLLNPRKPEYHYELARLYTQKHDTAQAKAELAEYEHQKRPEAK